jgi:hypothetical protein
MAEVYRKTVRKLVEGLTDPTKNLEVTEAIRTLVDRILLTPELRPGRKRATLIVDLEGSLAAILHLADVYAQITWMSGRSPSAIRT